MSRRIFGSEQMSDVQSLSVAGGTAVVLSTRHPLSDRDNQDAAAVFALGGENGVLAVADGMGGGRGGDRAARIVLRCLDDALSASREAGDKIRAAILDAVEAANQQILALGIGAATTLAAIELSGTTLRSYHIGDSEIVVTGQRGKVKLRTTAHSPTGYALEAGFLDEQEALQHEDRHLVSNMLGTPEMRIDVGSPIELAPKDTVVLATDGLFDNMSEKEIVDAVRTGSLAKAGRKLLGTCRRRMVEPRTGQPSKPDDLTFILYRRRTGPVEAVQFPEGR